MRYNRQFIVTMSTTEPRLSGYDAPEALTSSVFLEFARIGNRSMRCPTSCVRAVVTQPITNWIQQ
jgi:hypothetical protein